MFVPPGYSHGEPQFQLEEVRGGSPYGAGSLSSADGSRQPSDAELAYCQHQGRYFAQVVKRLWQGRETPEAAAEAPAPQYGAEQAP